MSKPSDTHSIEQTHPPRLRQTSPSAASIIFCANFAGPIFELAKNRDSLLIRVLVGDAGSQRLHIVDRHDTGVDQSRVRGFEPLFW